MTEQIQASLFNSMQGLTTAQTSPAHSPLQANRLEEAANAAPTPNSAELTEEPYQSPQDFVEDHVAANDDGDMMSSDADKASIPRTSELPSIPNKRYFTIGEVSIACGVKQHVLRFWEQEFPQLRPVKRRGNRRYYQHHEVLLIRRIRELLYDNGYTIAGAQRQLRSGTGKAPAPITDTQPVATTREPISLAQLRNELISLRNLLAATI